MSDKDPMSKLYIPASDVDTDVLRKKLAAMLDKGTASHIDALRINAELLEALPKVLRALDDTRDDVRRLEKETSRLNTELNKEQQSWFAREPEMLRELKELRANLAATQRLFTTELERRVATEKELVQVQSTLAPVQQALNAANDDIQRKTITIYTLRGDLESVRAQWERAEKRASTLEARPKVTTPDFLTQFRLLNVARSEEAFKHRLHDWGELEWGGAAAGELGELLNMLKKRRRGDVDAPSIADCAREAADTICYLDLLLARMRVDMARAVTLKFNEVSHRVGSPIRLTHESIEICPDCLRPAARNVDDAAAGCCPRWFGVRDPEAMKDCEKHMIPLRAEDLPGFPPQPKP